MSENDHTTDDRTVRIACPCAVSKPLIYYLTWHGVPGLLPAEVICTHCGNIIKLKDIIDAI